MRAVQNISTKTKHSWEFAHGLSLLKIPTAWVGLICCYSNTDMGRICCYSNTHTDRICYSNTHTGRICYPNTHTGTICCYPNTHTAMICSFSNAHKSLICCYSNTRRSMTCCYVLVYNLSLYNYPHGYDLSLLSDPAGYDLPNLFNCQIGLVRNNAGFGRKQNQKQRTKTYRQTSHSPNRIINQWQPSLTNDKSAVPLINQPYQW